MSTARRAWSTTEKSLPQRGERVVWIAPNGEEVHGSYEGAWMLPDGVYVYYTPQFWRYA